MSSPTTPGEMKPSVPSSLFVTIWPALAFAPPVHFSPAEVQPSNVTTDSLVVEVSALPLPLLFVHVTAGSSAPSGVNDFSVASPVVDVNAVAFACATQTNSFLGPPLRPGVWHRLSVYSPAPFLAALHVPRSGNASAELAPNALIANNAT